jgi:transcriptional regulator with XRE-family HTH domain
MGRKLGKRRAGPSRQLKRFAALVAQLEQAGTSQAEFARLTGIETTHVNKLRNYESSGRTSIGAEILALVKDGLKVDPTYFYDDYDDAEGVRDHRLYLLSAKRDEKRISAIEETMKRLELANARQEAELVRLRNDVVSGTGKQGANVSQTRR